MKMWKFSSSREAPDSLLCFNWNSCLNLSFMLRYYRCKQTVYRLFTSSYRVMYSTIFFYECLGKFHLRHCCSMDNLQDNYIVEMGKQVVQQIHKTIIMPCGFALLGISFIAPQLIVVT